jgi:signal transduction histidine kinase
MAEEKPARVRDDDVADGEVVYRRVSQGVDADAKGAKKRGESGAKPVEHRLAPTLTPLLIGFALLLALVLFLGYLSMRKLNEVSTEILYQQRQHSIRQSLTLKLLVATTRLNNEARARARAESGASTDVRPLFNQPLRNAREELDRLLPLLERPPYSQIEKWRTLHDDIVSFAQMTDDLSTYSLHGFAAYRDLDQEIGNLLKEQDKEQENILERRQDLQSAATRQINLWTWIVFLSGALVAAGTTWEVQRRFRQVRRGLLAARREREFSTQILEGMVSAVAAIDQHDRIRSANEAFLKIFPNASVGASVHDHFASPDAMRMLEAATASRVKRATYRGRWSCNTDDPECKDRTFDIYSSPLEIDGGQGQIVTMVDVTEAAETEMTLRHTEALAAVGQAAAQVAHEIKNPLGSIRLGVSMLRDTATDKESLNTIDLVERGINHLNKLVVDVSQFTGQRPLVRAEADLQDLLRESVELISARLKEKSTSVEENFSSEALRGQWDVDQLRQVFVNLLANAVDASPENSTVRIFTEPVMVESASDGGGGSSSGGGGAGNGHRSEGLGKHRVARIRIEDQGSGMDQETRRRIFEPFFTTKKRGTGLGLAIVKQIVESHGGTISFESAQDKGTRFTIDLPLSVNGPIKS